MAAIEIHGAKSLVGRGFGARIQVGVGIGVMLVFVRVVAEMAAASLRFMRAVRRHRRPAELKRQQRKQKDGKEAAHGRESSHHKPCPCGTVA